MFFQAVPYFFLALVLLEVFAISVHVFPLGEGYAGEHVKTLRRQLFNRPGQLYETAEALLVYLDPFAGQEALVPVIDTLNAQQHRWPWLDNRRLVISLTPTGPARAGP